MRRFAPHFWDFLSYFAAIAAKYDKITFLWDEETLVVPRSGTTRVSESNRNPQRVSWIYDPAHTLLDFCLTQQRVCWIYKVIRILVFLVGASRRQKYYILIPYIPAYAVLKYKSVYINILFFSRFGLRPNLQKIDVYI